MDTLILKQNKFEISYKTCEYVLIVLLLIILILSGGLLQSPIMANDLIANTQITTPTLIQAKDKILEEINPQARLNKFNITMSTKYSGYQIFNVADGIKHIKMASINPRTEKPNYCYQLGLCPIQDKNQQKIDMLKIYYVPKATMSI